MSALTFLGSETPKQNYGGLYGYIYDEEHLKRIDEGLVSIEGSVTVFLDELSKQSSPEDVEKVLKSAKPENFDAYLTKAADYTAYYKKNLPKA
jgi:hypothetical protein